MTKNTSFLFYEHSSVYSDIYSQEVEIKFNSMVLECCQQEKLDDAERTSLSLTERMQPKRLSIFFIFFISTIVLFLLQFYFHILSIYTPKYARLRPKKKTCALRLCGADLSCTCLNRHVA